MKGPALDKQLWHDKMQQLPLEGDEDAMWQKMLGLLDENMPAENPVVVNPPKNSPNTGSIVTAIVIAVIIAILLYFMLPYFSGHHKSTGQKSKTEKTDSNSIKTRSAKSLKSIAAQSANTTADSLNSTQKNSSEKSVPGNKNEPASDTASYINGKSTKNTATNNSTSSADSKLMTAKGKQAANGNKNVRYPGNKRNGKPSLLVAGNGNTRSAHLQKIDVKNKPGFGKKHSLNSGYLAKNNAGTQSTNGTTSGNSTVTGATTGNKQNQQDSLSSLLKNPQSVQNSFLLPGSPKPDSTGLLHGANNANPTNKQVNANNSAKNKTATSPNSKNKTAKNPGGGSKFELDLRAGLNTSSSSISQSKFGGIAASYYILPNLGIGVGADVSTPYTITGSYTQANLNYTTADTGKAKNHSTGKIIIYSSRKIYTVNVPLTVTYKINDNMSVYGGAVADIPVKSALSKSNLGLLTNSKDTTAAKEIDPYVSSTTISNKLNFSITGGIKLNVDRFYISGGYVQGLSPYTINTGLGSAKISYNTIQFSVGYQLFKPKLKKPKP